MYERDRDSVNGRLSVCVALIKWRHVQGVTLTSPSKQRHQEEVKVNVENELFFITPTIVQNLNSAIKTVNGNFKEEKIVYCNNVMETLLSPHSRFAGSDVRGHVTS